MSNDTPKKNNSSDPKTRIFNKQYSANETEVNKRPPEEDNFKKYLYYILPALLVLVVLAFGIKECVKRGSSSIDSTGLTGGIDPFEPDPVVTTPVEPDPVVTTPVEPDPVVTTPVEPDPVVTTPVEPDPVVTTPVEPDPVVTTPVEPDPVVQIDSDGDNIADNIDECEFTPKGVNVNNKGCPDFDNDGIADKDDPDIDNDGKSNEEDESDNTPTGHKVNEFGSSITKVSNYEKEIHNLDDIWASNPEKIESAIKDIVKNIAPGAKVLEKTNGKIRPITDESFEVLLSNQASTSEFGDGCSAIEVLNVVFDEGKITKILIERR